jgi:hypothetical protein
MNDRKFLPLAEFIWYTYSGEEDSVSDRSLPIEMAHPDSINGLDMETFSMMGKQIEI